MTTLVVTNDDGIEAPGLAALARIAATHGDVVVVAPRDPHSSTGHRVTVHAPIEVEERVPGRVYAVAGTPADCARLAVTHLAPTAGWVLAGINAGGNLGADVHPSGTVAAAREAALLGRRAVALSQYIVRGRRLDWELTEARAARALALLLARPIEAGRLWNVNLPHPAHDGLDLELLDCPLDPTPLPVEYRREGATYAYSARYETRGQVPGHDVARCFAGAITVSCLDSRACAV